MNNTIPITSLIMRKLHSNLAREEPDIPSTIKNNDGSYPSIILNVYIDGGIGKILNLKGNLRISWSFDIKHNKNIDLIFFPENNPYINYATLYAKDFPKNIDEESFMPRALKDIKIPYNINYDFVKEILSKAGFSESQQKRFFDVRFGSVLVPMEVEFEWYAIDFSYNKKLSFFKYDTFMGFFGHHEWHDFGELVVLVGIIKSHSLLTAIPNLEAYNIPWLKDNAYTEAKNSITKPLPTSALAYTKTNINDFIVNVRDKPDSKEGKIVAQLLSQSTIKPYVYAEDNENLNPIYKPMFDKGYEWYHKDNPKISSLDDASCYVLYYNFKMQQSYYNTNKSNLTNPLWRDNYLVLIWDILPNDWAKVWILKSPKFDIDSFDDKRTIIDENYKQTFLKTPSKLKLYEGYIHSSGLEYLAPFGENYVKR